MNKGADINYKLIINIIGLLVAIEGIFILSCLPFSWWYHSGDAGAIALSGGITELCGLTMWLFTRGNLQSFGKKEGYVVVSFTWVVISFFGSLPFLLSGAIGNFTDAYFETISGFTTTGSSILSDIEGVPKGVLFWRSMTHWIGGMGIIVLSLAILPILGIGGMQLFVAEVPGPTPDKLHPRMTGTAKRLWGIYVVFTAAETIMLCAGGMSLFDGLCHAFGTMATGGFSTKNDSIAGFSPYIQYVIILFMFLAGVNFTLHYFALKGRVLKYLKNEEFRYFLLKIGVVTLLITGILTVMSDKPLEEAFRSAAFQVVSIVTTTGFVSDNYMLWPSFSWFLIFLLMFTGGCAGSTGGGMKAVRLLLLLKTSGLELKRLIHPNAIIPVRLNGKPVSQEIVGNILAFFLIYMVIFAAGTFLMSILGLNFESAIGAVIASLGNIGPAIGTVGPVDNYAHIQPAGKWLLSFLMLLGRLELFTVLILFSRAFWKK